MLKNQSKDQISKNCFLIGCHSNWIKFYELIRLEKLNFKVAFSLLYLKSSLEFPFLKKFLWIVQKRLDRTTVFTDYKIDSRQFDNHNLWTVHRKFSQKTKTNSKFLRIFYLAHVIKQPIFRIPNLEYLKQNFCFDFLMILRTHFEASLKFRKKYKKLRDFNI